MFKVFLYQKRQNWDHPFVLCWSSSFYFNVFLFTGLKVSLTRKHDVKAAFVDLNCVSDAEKKSELALFSYFG